MLITRTRRQSGFGLVELMIGLLVGMIVVAAALSLLSTTMASSNDNIKMTRLDQELRQVMTMLTRDLRRATIWDPAVDVTRVSLAHPLTLSVVSGNWTVTSSSGNLGAIGDKAIGGTLVYKNGAIVNPLRGSITGYSGGSYSVTPIGTWPTTVVGVDGVPASSWNILRPESTITAPASGTTGSCILFVYDTDDSDSIGVIVNKERFGYRHDDTNKAVEIRTSAASADTCAIGGGGTWEDLTDKNTIKITNFSVANNSPTIPPSSGFTIAVRVFTISITGELKSDPSVVRTLQETVRVRNDGLS